MRKIQLTKRQEEIIQIVKNQGPITGEQIAEQLYLTRATLRPDLAILTMAGVLDARPRVGYYFTGKATGSLLADKLSKIKVGEIQSRSVAVYDTCTAYDAVVTMFTEDVGTLIVAGPDEQLLGVVSRKDLLKTAMGNTDLHKIPVGMVMTRMPNIITCSPEEPVVEAARKLIVHEVDALPVVETSTDSMGKSKVTVVGRLSKTSITRLLVGLAEGDL